MSGPIIELKRFPPFSKVSSLDVLKTAKHQYNKKYRLDEDYFKELRMYGFFTRSSDYTSECIKGKQFQTSLKICVFALLDEHFLGSD